MSCVGGTCQPSVHAPSIRCVKHACLWAKTTMEKRGWVCINEYGSEASEAVDRGFISMLSAVQEAKVDLQRWMAGWDEKRGTPIFGVWAPRAVAAIIGATQGKVSPEALAKAFIQAKLNPSFAAAVDAAWRMGGVESASQIIAAELPAVAAEINGSVG